MRISLTPLDKLFSKFIRARDKYCQRCGSPRSLQTAHFFSRKYKSVRYDEDNAMALCTGCHFYFHGNPTEFTAFMVKRLGQDKFDMLQARRQTIQKLDIEAVTIYIKNRIAELGVWSVEHCPVNTSTSARQARKASKDKSNSKLPKQKNRGIKMEVK